MNRMLMRRKATNAFMVALATGAALVALVFLGWILATLLDQGVRGLNVAWFTELPKPTGEARAGMANALAGTGLVVAMAIGLGVPIGLLAGIYLAEFGKAGVLARIVRFVADVLLGAPSIVIGVFVYTLMVRPTGHFSGVAGATALALLMLPIVTRTTDEMMRMVPVSLREAALALGAPAWKMIVRVSLKAALPGIMTGIILAIARVSGETAPLLFTALNSPYWSLNPLEPTATLNVTMFNYAMSPYADWRRMAWGAALVITAGVVLLTTVARATRRKAR
jgi:phosphate transport system permease protein